MADPVTVWVFCLVAAHFIRKYVQGAAAQGAAELRRARQAWAAQIGGRMDAALAGAGPGSSGWWWAGAARGAWRGMRGARPGATTALPHASPWRRILAAGWAHGRAGARQAWQAPRPVVNLAGAAASAAAVLAAVLAAAAGLIAGLVSFRAPARPRRRRRVRMAVCDRCGALVARESLQPVPVQAAGRVELWLMCVTCARGAGPEPEPAPELEPAGPEPQTCMHGHPAPCGLCDTTPEERGEIPDEAEAACPVQPETAEGQQGEERDDMTGTDLARQGEVHTHGQAAEAIAAVAAALDELGPQLEDMLRSLTAADAGRSQTRGVMELYGRTANWAAQVRGMLAEVTGRERPVVEAVSAAGGPEEIPGIAYLEEV